MSVKRKTPAEFYVANDPFLLWLITLAPRFNKWNKADTTQLDAVSRSLEEDAKLNTGAITFQSLIYEHPHLSFLLLGGTFQLCSLLCMGTLIMMADSVGRVGTKYSRVAAFGKSGAGALFIFFAAKLWLATAIV